MATTGLRRDLGAPYAHPVVASLTPLAGVLAPRDHWSPRDLRRLTRDFADRAAAELHQVARFDPATRWRLRLADSGEVEVWLVTWAPGQSSSWHEHDAASAFTVLVGELTETRAHPRTGTRAARHHAGRGAGAGPGHLHSLQNRGVLPAISVHAAVIPVPDPR